MMSNETEFNGRKLNAEYHEQKDDGALLGAGYGFLSPQHKLEWEYCAKRITAEKLLNENLDSSLQTNKAMGKRLLDQAATIQTLVEALENSNRKLKSYVGMCEGDKELNESIIPENHKALATVKEGK